MAPTDKAFADLKKEVVALTTSIRGIESRGWRKWIRSHPLRSVISGIIILGAIWPILTSVLCHFREDFGQAVDGRISAKLAPINTNIETIQTDLREITTTLDTLKPLINGLLLDRFKEATALPQNEFQHKLPEIKNLIALARQREVPVDPKLIRRMSEKLLNINPRVPDFWPASAQLVSYRSSNGAPSNVMQLASVNLPDCTDSEPQPMRITAVISPYEAKVSNALYENCRLTLDSPNDDERINSHLRGKFPRITFRKCLVIYRGGQINLMLEWRGEVIGFQVEGKPPMTVKMSGKTLEFENCLFEFSIQGVPPPTGQKMTEALLAQNSETLRLPHP